MAISEMKQISITFSMSGIKLNGLSGESEALQGTALSKP